jgi:hypothetical protein
VQVCDRFALAYYPNFVDLYDTQQYDLDLPERRAARIASESGVPVRDLGDALRSLPQCPYQPFNMHFTLAGHQAMAIIASQAIQVLGRAR